MKTTEFELNGRTHHLVLTGAALFDSYEHFGDQGEILDQITGSTRASFDATVWMLVKLAQQGELLRRYLGEDPTELLTVEEAVRTMSPLDVIRAKTAIRDAYYAGFEHEENRDEEIDLGLLELQKKTVIDRIAHAISTMRRKSST